MKEIKVKLDKRVVNRFNIIENTTIGKSLMIKIKEDDVENEEVKIEYQIKKTIWDSNEKDYCFNLLMFDRSNSYFYLYPQASEYYIPLIDGKKYFNDMVKEVFKEDINISGNNLDKLLQTFKLNFDIEENIEYLRECIESSMYQNQKTNIGKLLYQDYNKRIKIKENDCRIFMYKFTQSIISLIEVFNNVMSSIEGITEEGLFNSNILIHKNLKSFFDTELWKKLKEIYGCYDREFIIKGRLAGMFYELSTNVLFVPFVQEYLNRALLSVEEMDKIYNELTESLDMEYYITDSNAKDDYMNIAKVLNIVDMLSNYETSIYQSLPLLNSNDIDNMKVLNMFNYKKKQLMNLADLNKIKKLGTENKTEDSMAENILKREFEDNTGNNIDTSLYIMPRRFTDLLSDILNKYFI